MLPKGPPALMYQLGASSILLTLISLSLHIELLKLVSSSFPSMVLLSLHTSLKHSSHQLASSSTCMLATSVLSLKHSSLQLASSSTCMLATSLLTGLVILGRLLPHRKPMRPAALPRKLTLSFVWHCKPCMIVASLLALLAPFSRLLAHRPRKLYSFEQGLVLATGLLTLEMRSSQLLAYSLPGYSTKQPRIAPECCHMLLLPLLTCFPAQRGPVHHKDG